MEKYTHIKINLGKHCLISHDTSIRQVRDRIELLIESRNSSGLSIPSNYYAILDAVDNGDYEYINMDKKPGKRKRLAKEKNLQS